MRGRIVGVALASVALALLIFSVPLGIAVRHLYVADEQGELERSALQTAVGVSPRFSSGDPAELPVVESGSELGLYDANGVKVSGQGPNQADASVRTALTGDVGKGQTSSALVVSVPVAYDEQVLGVVRAASPVSALQHRIWFTWAAIAVVAAISMALATLLATVLARRLSTPLGAVAEASQRLGGGDFSVRADRSGVAEIDMVASAMNATASRLGEVVERERLIAGNVSHQLRTPVAGLRATLEHALVDPSTDLRSAAERAVESARTLETTIEDIIGLTRGDVRPLPELDVVPVVERLQRRWNGPLAEAGRPLRIEVTSRPATVRAAAQAIEQILDVLVENALRHGAGAVVISVRSLEGAIAVDVTDEGSGISDDDDVFTRGVSTTGGPGIGLALARGLASDQGARLLLTQRKPTTRFTLLLLGTPEDLR